MILGIFWEAICPQRSINILSENFLSFNILALYFWKFGDKCIPIRNTTNKCKRRKIFLSCLFHAWCLFMSQKEEVIFLEWSSREFSSSKYVVKRVNVVTVAILCKAIATCVDNCWQYLAAFVDYFQSQWGYTEIFQTHSEMLCFRIYISLLWMSSLKIFYNLFQYFSKYRSNLVNNIL